MRRMKRYFFLILLVLACIWICQNNPAGAQVQGNSVTRGPTIGVHQPGSSILSSFNRYSSSVEFDASRYSRTQPNPLAFNQRNAKGRVNSGTPSVLSRSSKFLPSTVSNRLDSVQINPGDAFQNLDNLLTSRPSMHSSRALANSRIASVENQLGPLAPIRSTNIQTGYLPRLSMPSLSLSRRGTLAVRSRLSNRNSLAQRMSMVESAQKMKSIRNRRSINSRRNSYLQNSISNSSFSRTGFLSGSRATGSFLRR